MPDHQQRLISVLANALERSPFASNAATLLEAIHQSSALRHGQWPDWLAAIKAMEPGCQAAHLDQPTIEIHTTPVPEASLRALMPWRKGPFRINTLSLDCEWRSDWKWERIAAPLGDIDGARVLDVGGGNGYFSLRLSGAGASAVMNIDPTALFVAQFLAIQRLIDEPRVITLPLTLESLPDCGSFDYVLSMGVLYHRPDPIGHLKQLAKHLEPGGRLLLETLVVPGNETQCLTPQGRYARMRNVWFVPSTAMLTTWLEKCGFIDVAVVDASYTTTEEQRTTDWMPFESLRDALDPNNGALTIEGHPAPLRAVLVARKA